MKKWFACLAVAGLLFSAGVCLSLIHIFKVVSGVRRCGKSTLFELFKQELLASGVKANQIISINFEDLEYEPLQEYHALHEYIVKPVSYTHLSSY